jgi:transposase InsO family protein
MDAAQIRHDQLLREHVGVGRRHAAALEDCLNQAMQLLSRKRRSFSIPGYSAIAASLARMARLWIKKKLRVNGRTGQRCNQPSI